MASNVESTSSWRIERDGDHVRLGGELRMADAPAIWAKLREATKDRKATDFDLTEVTAIDGGVMALLVEVRADLGARLSLTHARESVQPLLHLYGGDEKPLKKKKRRPESTIAHIGRSTSDVIAEVKGILAFVGAMTLAFLKLFRRPKTGHWKEVPPLAERTGADAIPIVILINFLVGFVMAYQSAKQLKMFGANIFVADLVGLSITRELGPLMTAIIVCGRSGAAFAAEIGSMKVSEEVDALRTLGLPPFGWLAMPRILALVLVMPILTLVGDLVGLLGGLVVGVTSLDITVRGYLIESQKAIGLWDIGSGLIKSLIFGMTIALVACQQGFSASGGAEGVGRRTTSTVVTCLFALVLLDATFTVFLRVFDL